MLGRVLGYGDGSVAAGANGYGGYVGVAQSSGLGDGLSLSGSSTISRGQAAAAVEKGAAQVNWTVCQKPDKPVAAGDTITCRGLGKCVLDSVGGPTKKGRLPVVIRRFV